MELNERRIKWGRTFLGSLILLTVGGIVGIALRDPDLLDWRHPFQPAVTFPEMSASQLKALGSSFRVHFLDARSASEFSRVHIPGATLAGMGWTCIPKDQLVVVYSGSQERPARDLVIQLGREGYRMACLLKGGLPAWQQECLPTESSPP